MYVMFCYFILTALEDELILIENGDIPKKEKKHELKISLYFVLVKKFDHGPNAF